MKGKGRAIPGRRDRQKQDPSDPPPKGNDSSWEETKDRFVWKLLEEYYFGPPGRSIDPEMAFASINKHIKEDLHRSVSSFFYHNWDHRLMNLLIRQ